MIRHSLLLYFFVPLVCMYVLSGCGGGQRIARENDRLRERVHEVEKQLEHLTQRNTELKAELAQQSAQPDSIPEDIRANTPRVSEIKIGRLSHARDEDRNGYADTLIVYVRPADGLGRFIQIVGSLKAHAVVLPADSDAVTIGRRSLSPGEVREAFRASIRGYIYTVEVPISLPDSDILGLLDDCQVRVIYTDGHTGQEFSATRTISLTPHTR